VESLQPLPSVPTTVYVAFDPGDTVRVEAPEPVFQLYVLAPPADSVAVEPMHIEAGDAAAVTVGTGLTVTVDVAVAEQLPAEPVTV
jgi:galactose mutarotase-like enzyme